MDIEHAAATHGSSSLEAIPASLVDTPDEMVGHPVSASEVSFFKESGYLVKRGLLKRASLQPALDYVWQRAPGCVSRNDPSSYTNAHRLWDRTAVNGERGGDQNHWSGARGDNGLWQLLSSGPTGLAARGESPIWGEFVVARDGQSEWTLRTSKSGECPGIGRWAARRRGKARKHAL